MIGCGPRRTRKANSLCGFQPSCGTTPSPRGKARWHSEENRLAHLSPHILKLGKVPGCGREGGAGTGTPCLVQYDDEWLHSGVRTIETPSARTTCRPNHAHGNSWSRMNVVECCGKNCPDAAKCLICWRPRRDLNPCYRRESTRADGKLLKLRSTDGY